MSAVTPPVAWVDSSSHHRWLRHEQDRLLSFHESHALGSRIGFAPLDQHGQPESEQPRQLYATARLVHCFALAHMLGRPGARTIAEHGLAAILGPFSAGPGRGWYTSLTPSGEPLDTTRSAYDHAFVILAASSAAQADLPGARQLLAAADQIVTERFWIEQDGAVVDSLDDSWRILEPNYRGQNANMHLVEAYTSAFELTGEERYQQRAERIADRIVHRDGRTLNWRVPEHYDQTWTVQPDFNIDKPADPFRPHGSLVGHWFEWARLILQLDALPGSAIPWAQEAAADLFAAGIRDGWDAERGGFVYSIDFAGRHVNTDRMHWVIAEALGAAVYLWRATKDPSYDSWYRVCWDYTAITLRDLHGGSWWHQVDSDGHPMTSTWPGKPDLYHALQATLYARADPRRGLATVARTGEIR
jgi:sulfoquinovose isomerase